MLPQCQFKDHKTIFDILLFHKACLDAIEQFDHSLHVVSLGIQYDAELARNYFQQKDIDLCQNMTKISVGQTSLFVSDCINMDWDDRKYLVTAKSVIPKGTIVFTERPFTYLKSDMLKMCTNCDVEIQNVFWPCEFCNEVAFCDILCFNEV